MIELAGANRLGDFRERELHRVEIDQRRNLEPVWHVIAKGACTTQAATALPEVVIAVFVALERDGEPQ
jgi:hypothetical protein